jgi:molybdopterin converting factor subunit 1
VVRVRVRFFGGPREALGKRALHHQLASGSTAKELVDSLDRAHPALRQYSYRIKIAVNRRYADPETELHEGDEVAYIPPVAGG